jgi:hypothetical protein
MTTWCLDRNEIDRLIVAELPLGRWFGKHCDRAGLPRCQCMACARGATNAAENGATAHQLKAIFGRRTLKQPEVYTWAAEQKPLAESAMRLLVTRRKSG